MQENTQWQRDRSQPLLGSQAYACCAPASRHAKVPDTYKEWFYNAKLAVNKLSPAMLALLRRFLTLKVRSCCDLASHKTSCACLRCWLQYLSALPASIVRPFPATRLHCSC